MDGYPELPTEIWVDIIGTLSQPVHPLAYCLDPTCTSRLAQLCLVNSSFNAVATPCLYSRCVICQPHWKPSCDHLNRAAPGQLETAVR